MYRLLVQALAVLAASSLAAADPEPGHGHKPSKTKCATCYTPTVTTTEIVPCPAFPPPGGCGPVPDCILLKSTVIPYSTCSGKTATVTTIPCRFCQTGCATATTTITAPPGQCVYPSPTSCSYSTVTTTSGIINCPLEPVCSSPAAGGYGGYGKPTKGCKKTVTLTQPSSDPWCPFTPTVTVAPTCPTGSQVCCPTITKTVTATTPPPYYG